MPVVRQHAEWTGEQPAATLQLQEREVRPSSLHSPKCVKVAFDNIWHLGIHDVVHRNFILN